jgi:hypothetical protein
MKKKCYVLMVSRFFPKGHPQEGKETGFVEKILSGEKIHTIRGNYEWWKKRIDKINAGEAYMSVRYWSGVPRHSNQVTFLELSSVGIENIDITYFIEDMVVASIPQSLPDLFPLDIENNDGLEYGDFVKWFFPKGEKDKNNGKFTGAILHFTDFRYESHKS